MSIGPDSLRGGVERLLRVAKEQQARVAEVEAERAELTAVGHSADGLVSVTLDHDMKVTGIDINARAMRLSSYQLADGLREALDAAYAEIEERSTELMGKIVGDPELIRGAKDGSVNAQDWFKRFGVDMDSIFRNPPTGR